MLRLRLVVTLLASIAVLGCSYTDPGAPTFLVGAMPTASEGVGLRIGSCLPGTLEQIVVTSDHGSEDDRPVLWRVTSEPEGGPEISSDVPFEVVLGTAPAGFVEDEPLDQSLGDEDRVQVEITMSSQSFDFFFEPDQLESGTVLLRLGDREDVDDFDAHLADLCS